MQCNITEGQNLYQFIMLTKSLHTTYICHIHSENICTPMLFVCAAVVRFVIWCPLFQKEHEQRRRRKSKAQFFEMIQEIRRYAWVLADLHSIFVCLFIYLFIKSSACSITVSNTTCYFNHTVLLLVFIYICLLEWFIFSKVHWVYVSNELLQIPIG